MWICKESRKYRKNNAEKCGDIRKSKTPFSLCVFKKVRNIFSTFLSYFKYIKFGQKRSVRLPTSDTLWPWIFTAVKRDRMRCSIVASRVTSANTMCFITFVNGVDSASNNLVPK